MHHVRQKNLPFVGSSYEFVGVEQGNTDVSVFLFHGKPGSGPGPHRHPYDEIQFIREGRGVWTVNSKTFEGSAGDIFVIKAGEVHSFKAVGDSPLIQVDVHLSPRFVQENLQSRNALSGMRKCSGADPSCRVASFESTLVRHPFVGGHDLYDDPVGDFDR
jgi:quercetin dioxygenase-like cupin family protein